jgi:prepilin-type N-terminal cleavage/methylation domain-containing protein
MTSKAGDLRDGGFTLIELLVTVGIMGMLLGAAAIAVRGLRAPALASAANEVASAMKMTRQMAVGSGRKMVMVVPITPIPQLGMTNPFRSYAIFEEVRPGEEVSTATGFYTNPATMNAAPFYVARTDWRTLPEGVVFCNLVASGNYSTIAGDPFTDYTLGSFFSPTLGRAGRGGEEWKFFESFRDFDFRRASSPQQPLATNRAAFLGFHPSGRAFYEGVTQNANLMQGAALRLVPGIVRSNAIAITDTNNYFYIETDAMIGRVRVRSRDSYR